MKYLFHLRFQLIRKNYLRLSYFMMNHTKLDTQIIKLKVPGMQTKWLLILQNILLWERNKVACVFFPVAVTRCTRSWKRGPNKKHSLLYFSPIDLSLQSHLDTNKNPLPCSDSHLTLWPNGMLWLAFRHSSPH